ncbi:MAG: glycosyltransferase family 4 protein [Bacteroidales bacterium]|jgi:glycosyltransferase involved in cell wall biosynthesis|nr:glycosyltransferase family 4 protein [Bacteroidales bacterium]
MKIVYLITGSGGSFYCGNCYRDMLYVRAIRKVRGVIAKPIPLYLPPDKAYIREGFEKEVFFGAISMYLREKVRIFRNMPAFMDKLVDSNPLLKLAARQAGATRTEGYEDLTLNMIEGDNAFRSHEVDRLVRYLLQDDKPDVIHLSNALILGLARQIKKRMDIKIVCSLLNEDDWIDDMAEPYQSKAWSIIAKEAVHVDDFITPSSYSKELFKKKTGLSGENVHVVPLGFDPENTIHDKTMPANPSLGYFCRVNSHNGFDKLADAFLEIKSNNLVPDLSLHVCGGFTGDDKPFISDQIKKFREKGFQKSVRIYPEFLGNKKMEFFRNVNVISVPVRKYDGYGLYILEANGAGIPVVQPATGAFPEILGMTSGGIVYSPDNKEELVKSLVRLLIDPSMQKEFGDAGSKNVRSKLSLEKMSIALSEIYNRK